MRTYAFNGVFLCLLIAAGSCSKDNNNKTPVPPYLTDRVWTLDTITIRLPATYNTLSDADKLSYHAALGWLKGADVWFNSNGTAADGPSGNWDFGYASWKLINNSADLEVTLAIGSKDTLRSWTADAKQFSYVHPVTANFDGLLIFK